MDRERYFKKRTSLVGGGLATFEGAAAADQFASRQSSYRSRVRQSIPDIRFDEHGMPISTRQLLARSHSLVEGSLFPADRRLNRDGTRRAFEHVDNAEKNVRKLSKKFSLTDEEELKANFTIPANTRTGMFGTNRRWSTVPEWMKKRPSSVKEEFIEKNLSNLEMLLPTYRKEVKDEMESILEEMASSVGEKTRSVSENEEDSRSKDESSTSGTGSSSEECSDSEDGQFRSDGSVGDKTKKFDERETQSTIEDNENALNTENPEEIVTLGTVGTESEREQPISGKRRSKFEKKKKSGTKEDVLPRPPPPPLPIQMCDVTDFWDAPSSSDEDDDTVLTQYGKQKMFVNTCYHVFETSNGPLKDGRK